MNWLKSTGTKYYTYHIIAIWTQLNLTGPRPRLRARQGNWQLQRNRNFRELLSAWIEHMWLNGTAQIGKLHCRFLSCQFPRCTLGLRDITTATLIEMGLAWNPLEGHGRNYWSRFMCLFFCVTTKQGVSHKITSVGDLLYHFCRV
jgi:hypothetical protein